MTNLMTMPPMVYRDVIKMLTESLNSSAKISELLDSARRFADIARTEMERGGEARELGERIDNAHLQRIAHWHYRRCAAKARLAEADFLRAHNAELNPERRKSFRSEADEMSKLAALAESNNRI